ncbi:MAG: ABC transporter ATP-binding protein, partial [Clostridiaceae bacterium]|nr:ABC transporter ATP-binding protein [Clostridiaceae bacterium]
FLTRRLNREKDDQAVFEALELTGMTEKRTQSVLTLSGGELQRTFLAQLLAQNPRLLLLDEPANHLDLIYQKQIFTLISDWIRQEGRAVISVVHDLSLAKAFGTKAILMNKGKDVALGDVDKVLSPDHLDAVYGMDVGEWMRTMLGQWSQ